MRKIKTKNPIYSYSFYLERRKTKTEPIDEELFKKAVELMLFKIARAIITENFVFEFPHRLGNLKVVKVKQRGKEKPIDFIKSDIPNGKIIRHTNLHTNGYYFRFFFINVNSIKYIRSFKNKKFYKLIPCSDVFKRQVGKRGLAEEVQRRSQDPYLKDYDAPIYRYTYRKNKKRHFPED